ncbi:uncharacterized protein LOC100892209 isoform X2 [Strongylocentrotus purpuratus]|uniref:Uncharacterized protein n=1 Tax=Strongylocentrotus purpuratus TaxID=7668 RepID=A0A7M7NAP9_STRPU|nr:uncharacterized protein LOC100892209 isoform X2 [Strongylocentrotus purpuratus]
MSTLFAYEKNRSDNPFYDVPEPRAFYHPTLPKNLTKKTQGISLSPERVKSHLKANEDLRHGKGKELSPGEKGFLSGSNTMLAKELPTHDTPSPGPADTSSKFDESWPASERPSTIESPGDAQNVSSTSAATSHVSGSGVSPHTFDPTTNTSRQNSKQDSDSTLARLIGRFRYGTPQSREERAQHSTPGSKDFWWLFSSSSSPPLPSHQLSSSSISGHATIETTPIRGTGLVGGVRGIQGARRGTGSGSGRARGAGRGASRVPTWSGVSKSGVSSLSSSRRVSGVSTLTSSSSSSLKTHSSGTDKETDEIQRRAEKLLEISDRTILSEPAVSSDGVGSFSTSSPVTDENTPSSGSEAYTSRYHDKENLPRPPLFPANLSYTERPQGLEEDILQQWRMRRRMEQAKEGALYKVSGQRSQIPLRQTQQENVRTRDGTEEGDSRLADFRRRLEQQRLLTEARDASNVPQVPVIDATTTHTGTDPIPQSIATQTGRGVPSCDQTGSRSLSSGQTACLLQERTSTSDTMQGEDEEFSNQRVYPVASPNIQDVRTHRGHELERLPNITPHLHMSCDILPCDKRGPHVHSARDVVDKVKFVGHGKMHHHQTETDHEHAFSDDHLERDSVVRNNASENLPHRQTVLPGENQRATSEDNRLFSLPKQSHLQEKRHKYGPETRTNEAEFTSPRSEGHHVGDDIKGEDRIYQYDAARKGYRTLSSNDIPGRGTILDPELQTAAEDARTARQPQPSPTRTRTLEDTPEYSTAAITIQGIDASPVARQQQRTDDADNGEGAKRQLHFSSSSSINSAIGQVICNRMFSSPVGRRSQPPSQRSTPSSIRSSALSQDTLMFTPPMGDRVPPRERISRDNISEPTDPRTIDSASGASSDSEEFKDDEMLEVLRKQREECIRQLNHLDNLLPHTSKD